MITACTSGADYDLLLQEVHSPFSLSSLLTFSLQEVCYHESKWFKEYGTIIRASGYFMVRIALLFLPSKIINIPQEDILLVSDPRGNPASIFGSYMDVLKFPSSFAIHSPY